MSKQKEKDEKTTIRDVDFLNCEENEEEVPTLNNESDNIQNILKEVQQNTKDIEIKIDKNNSNNGNNVVNVDFRKKK